MGPRWIRTRTPPSYSRLDQPQPSVPFRSWRPLLCESLPPVTVWRIKINSGRGDVEPDAARAYCRQAGVVGVGWCDLDLPATASLDETLAAAAEVPDWDGTGTRMIRRLAEQVDLDDLVWTRDKHGAHWLGKVTGPWQFDPSGRKWDLGNVRDCDWLDRSFRDYEIPGAVVRSSSGPGETLRRVPHPAVETIAGYLWTRETDPDAPRPKLAPHDVVTGLLDPTDAEDVALMLMQWDGWLLLPSSRMRDTPTYEAALRHRDDGRLAVVSVKSGPSAPVPISELAREAGKAQAYACSTHDRYSAPPQD